MATSTLEREETAVRDLFARVDEVLDVAHSIEVERPQDAARLVHVSHGGLLTSGAVRPRLLIDAERLHTVLRFLSDLRAAGQDRDFREMLWNRLQDEALLDRAYLTESLSQMNSGNARPALTLAEERKERRKRR